MTTLHFYTRRGCHLCEVMLEELLPMIAGRTSLEIRDIDTDENWRREFDVRVPVLACDDRVVSEYPLDQSAVLDLLAALPAIPDIARN